MTINRKQFTKMASALALASSLAGCASYHSITQSGAVIEGVQTPFFSNTRIAGVDQPTVNANQITAVVNSKNPDASCIGNEAREIARRSGNELLQTRSELDEARARANGRTAAPRPNGC